MIRSLSCHSKSCYDSNWFKIAAIEHQISTITSVTARRNLLLILFYDSLADFVGDQIRYDPAGTSLALAIRDSWAFIIPWTFKHFVQQLQASIVIPPRQLVAFTHGSIARGLHSGMPSFEPENGAEIFQSFVASKNIKMSHSRV